jgi:hypothetical protein
MKPGKYDKKHSILIAGAELLELKRHTWMMPKALVLTDIENYQGKRPMGLYRQ